MNTANPRWCRWSLVLVVALSACAGAGGTLVQREKPQLTATRPDLATLVIVRPTSYGWGAVADNFLDGQLVGRTRGKSYNVAMVPPGPHYVMGRIENIAVARVNFEPGKVYFLHQGITPGVWKARTLFSTLTLEDGLRETDDPDCDYRILDPSAERQDLSREDFEEARTDFEKEVVSDPERHRDTLGYRGFAPGAPAAPALVGPTVPTAAPAPAAPAPAPAPGAPPCGKDTDCPGNDICSAGACVGPAAPASNTPPPASSGQRCGKDVDCPGNEVCEAGSCHPPR